MNYSYKKRLDIFFAEAVEEVKHALSEEGFGVLTEVDVKETLKKKLGVEYENYIILGACNPLNAYKALQSEKEIGLFLPCNILVYQDKGAVYVSAILPSVAMSVIENNSLLSVAKTVEDKLKKVIDNL